MYCRICGSNIQRLDLIKGNLADVTNYYDSYVSEGKIDIEVYMCDKCGHVQIKEMLDADYYENYEILYNEDERKTAYPIELLDYYDRCFAKFKKFGVGKSVLDIGCASGEMLLLLKRYFMQTYGIEPSKKLAKRAENKGFKVVNDYFGKSVRFDCKFDCITCLMVLEHIDELNDFLEAIYENLEEGGVVMIDVPNGSKILEEQSYYDIFPEHVNYFTEKSMMELAYRNGLKLIHLEEEFGRGFHLTVFLRKPYKKALFSEKKNLDIENLNAVLRNAKSTGIWGVGVRARNIISLIDKDSISKVKYLFDRNVAIEGKMIPNIDIPICKPIKEKVEECDLIIITSIEYCNEIISTLKEEYHYSGKICYISGGKYLFT